MVDIVSANEFTFTPSAFIAAYIEQEERTSVTESTANGGELSTTPNEIGNISLSNTGYTLPGSLVVGSGPDYVSQVLFGGVSTTSPVSTPIPNGNNIILSSPSVPGTDTDLIQATISMAYQGAAPLTVVPTVSKVGILNSSVDGPVTAAGSLVELVGQDVQDTRTTSKTVITAVGATNTVVLVLSYGQFRSKCVDAQATVTRIYQEVASYLNSL